MATLIGNNEYLTEDLLTKLTGDIANCKNDVTDKINNFKSLLEEQKAKLFNELDEIFVKQVMKLESSNADIKNLLETKEENSKKFTKNGMKTMLDEILTSIDKQINLIKERFMDKIPFVAFYTNSNYDKDIFKSLSKDCFEIRESIGAYKYKRDPVWMSDQGQLDKSSCLCIDKLAKLIYVGGDKRIQVYDMAGKCISTINTPKWDSIHSLQVTEKYFYMIASSNTDTSKDLVKMHKQDGKVEKSIFLKGMRGRIAAVDNSENLYIRNNNYRNNTIIPVINVYKCSDLAINSEITLKSEHIVRDNSFIEPTLEDIKILNNKLYTLFANCKYELLIFSKEGNLLKSLITSSMINYPCSFCIDNNDNIIIAQNCTNIMIYSPEGELLHIIGEYSRATRYRRYEELEDHIAIDVCYQTIILLYTIPVTSVQITSNTREVFLRAF